MSIIDAEDKLQRIQEILTDAEAAYDSEPQSDIFEKLLEDLEEVIPFERSF